MTEALIPVWERVLQQSPIRPDDNFFDLRRRFAFGGHSVFGSRETLRTATAAGDDLQHADHRRACRRIGAAQHSSASSTGPAAQGSAEPPVFIAHGLGGSVIDFYRLLDPHPLRPQRLRNAGSRHRRQSTSPSPPLRKWHSTISMRFAPCSPTVRIFRRLFSRRAGLHGNRAAPYCRGGARRAADRAGCLSESQPAFSLAAFPAFQPAGMAKVGSAIGMFAKMRNRRRRNNCALKCPRDAAPRKRRKLPPRLPQQ